MGLIYSQRLIEMWDQHEERFLMTYFSFKNKSVPSRRSFLVVLDNIVASKMNYMEDTGSISGCR